jgi:plastocyanin
VPSGYQPTRQALKSLFKILQRMFLGDSAPNKPEQNVLHYVIRRVNRDVPVHDARRKGYMKSGAIVVWFVAATVALSLAVGCSAARSGNGGGGGGNAPTESKGSVVKTIRVEETEYSLKPTQSTLEKPGIYVLEAVNSGETTHALEVEGEGIEEFSDKIEPGESTKLRVDLKPGTYGLTCPVDGHEDKGMETTITVKEG